MSPFLALCLALVPAADVEDEPFYAGKPLSHWIVVLQSKADRDFTRKMEFIIEVELGPEAQAAVPTLLSIIDSGDDDVVLTPLAALALARIGPAAVPGLRDRLGRRDLRVRLAAVLGLRMMEPPHARPTLTVLRDALKDDGLRDHAAAALANHGPDAKEALPALRELLTAKNASVRIQAARGLWRIGRNADIALPILFEALKSENSSHRADAVAALGEIVPEAKKIVAAVGPCVRDKHEAVRREAACALAHLATVERAAARPFLLQGLEDKEDFCVRWWAALGLLADDDIKLRAKVLAALNEGSERRLHRLGALETTARLQDRAVPLLRPALQSKEENVRKEVHLAVEALGRAGRDLAPLLLEQLKSKDRKDRDRVLRTLAALDLDPILVLPVYAGCLNDMDGSVRWVAANALTGLGWRPPRQLARAAATPEAKAQTLTLKSALRDDEARIRAAAVLALWWLERDVHRDALDAALEAADAYGRRSAAQTSLLIGPAARSTIPALCALLKDPDENTRTVAVQALARMHADAMPHLERVLWHPDPVMRLGAVKAMEEIGPACKPGQALTDLFFDRDTKVAAAVEQAIPAIYPDKAENLIQILKTLKQLRKDQEENLRRLKERERKD